MTTVLLANCKKNSEHTGFTPFVLCLTPVEKVLCSSEKPACVLADSKRPTLQGKTNAIPISIYQLFVCRESFSELFNIEHDQEPCKTNSKHKGNIKGIEYYSTASLANQLSSSFSSASLSLVFLTLHRPSLSQQRDYFFLFDYLSSLPLFPLPITDLSLRPSYRHHTRRKVKRR